MLDGAGNVQLGTGAIVQPAGAGQPAPYHVNTEPGRPVAFTAVGMLFTPAEQYFCGVTTGAAGFSCTLTGVVV